MELVEDLLLIVVNLVEEHPLLQGVMELVEEDLLLMRDITPLVEEDHLLL